MTATDIEGQSILGQSDFGGGMNALAPAVNQYVEARNIVIRDRHPTTRPGIRRRWRSTAAGALAGFYFNEDNERYNDDDHTGFWFPFEFASYAEGPVQGVGLVRFPTETEDYILFATTGIVYRQHPGYLETIPCTPAITQTEDVTFVQAEDYCYLFRGEDLQPMRWDGGEAGFVLVPDAAVGENIPYCVEGVYHTGGRMWCFRDQSDVYASAILDPTEWDLTTRRFGVRSGDGDELMRLVPFHEDIILCFKRTSVTALMNVNAVIEAGTDLSDYVQLVAVDTSTGLVARRATVIVGEDVWYLGYGGIYSLARNQENKLERGPRPVSGPIQVLIDRINWNAVEVAAAALYKNYVMFAVPLDESTVNNAMLVYDLLAPAGDDGELGAWLGSWTSKGKIMSVEDFLHTEEKLYFMDSMGVVRQMFAEVPWDSDEPFADTEVYDADETYYVGDVAVNSDLDTLYERLLMGSGDDLTDTDNWQAITDPQHYYDIEMYLKTRQFYLDAPRSAVRLGRGEVLYRHKDPKLSLELVSRDYGTGITLVTDKEYSQVAYDIAPKDDWDPDTEADEFHDPHRQDYTVILDNDGLLVGNLGFVVGIWEGHAWRFILNWVNDRGFGLELTNRRGMLKLISVSVPVLPKRWAAKNVL